MESMSSTLLLQFNERTSSKKHRIELIITDNKQKLEEVHPALYKKIKQKQLEIPYIKSLLQPILSECIIELHTSSKFNTATHIQDGLNASVLQLQKVKLA